MAFHFRPALISSTVSSFLRRPDQGMCLLRYNVHIIRKQDIKHTRSLLTLFVTFRDSRGLVCSSSYHPLSMQQVKPLPADGTRLKRGFSFFRMIIYTV